LSGLVLRLVDGLGTTRWIPASFRTTCTATGNRWSVWTFDRVHLGALHALTLLGLGQGAFLKALEPKVFRNEARWIPLLGAVMPRQGCRNRARACIISL